MFFNGASRIGPKGKTLLVWGLCLSHHKIMSFLGHFLWQNHAPTMWQSTTLYSLPLARPWNGDTLPWILYDSKLIVNQVKGEYEVRHKDLVPYHHAVIEMANLFNGFYISHVSRSQNTKADALAALATTLALPVNTKYHLTVATRHLVCSKHILRTKEVYNISTNLEPRDWRFPLIDYALHGLLPDDPKEAASIR